MSDMLASGKIRDFIRKNKTLSVVVGVGAAYFGYRQLKHGDTEVEEIPGESPGFAGGGEGPLMPSEISNEGPDHEMNRIEEEQEEERNRRSEEREQEEENTGRAKEKSDEEVEEAEERGEKRGESNSGSGEESSTPEAPESPSLPEGPPIETPPQTPPVNKPGITVHGRFFANAVRSTIVGSGSTEGNKKFIEYAIYFPGRVEHWQYFTATGNWREVKNSSTNPGSNGGKQGGHPPSHPPVNKPKDPMPKLPGNGIGNNHPVTHPGDGGGNKGGGGGGGNQPPVCPAGTVQNIQQNRDEVNRLTDEIKQRKQWINEHPHAQQRGQWEAEIRDKEGKRSAAQGAVDRGHQVPGCGNV